MFEAVWIGRLSTNITYGKSTIIFIGGMELLEVGDDNESMLVDVADVVVGKIGSVSGI